MKRQDHYTTHYDAKKINKSTLKAPLKKGEYSIGDFIFNVDQNNCLGDGTYAQVYKGKSGSNKQLEIAIKIFKIDLIDKESINACRQETLRQELLKSDGVVKIYSSKIIKIGEQNKFVVAMELMKGGQLKIPKEGLPPNQALQLIKKVLKCYSFLYRSGIFHRDLKLQNILINISSYQLFIPFWCQEKAYFNIGQIIGNKFKQILLLCQIKSFALWRSEVNLMDEQTKGVQKQVVVKIFIDVKQHLQVLFLGIHGSYLSEEILCVILIQEFDLQNRGFISGNKCLFNLTRFDILRGYHVHAQSIHLCKQLFRFDCFLVYWLIQAKQITSLRKSTLVDLFIIYLIKKEHFLMELSTILTKKNLFCSYFLLTLEQIPIKC